MSQLFALWGPRSQTWITFQGRVLTHDNRAELEFLFPAMKVVPFRADEVDAMSIKDHPQMSPVQWPLDRRNFR